ncbi:MAG: hypothetical protein AB7N65_28885 [Vicinamibacterales bacterium]
MRTLIAAIALVSSVIAGSAQQVAAPTVVASVNATAERSGDLVRFTFEVVNSPSSPRPIMMFSVPYGSTIGVEDLEGPPGWLVNPAVGAANLVGWTALSGALLSPGQRAVGFAFTANGLPGIVDGFVVGLPSPKQIPRFPEGQAPESYQGLTVAELGTKMRVLGPVAPPETFRSPDFLRHLASLLSEAGALGWIDGSVLLTSLQAKILAAQASVERGNVRAAANQLAAVLNEVRAQSGKKLTTGAASLLQLNIEFALDRMR